MRPRILSRCLLAAGVSMALQVDAAEVRINGFASIVGGTTLDESTARSPAFDPARLQAGMPGVFSNEQRAFFVADSATEGAYDDEISFKPDSNYGIQITADLGDGLQVVGQLTGHGGEDFETQVSWAYVSYDLMPELNLQAGRQRIPLFFYSDFLDVGYAYHWIRVPQNLPLSNVDTFEGAKISWSPSTSGDFGYTFEAYAGAGDEDLITVAGPVNASLNNLVGLVAKASNDWLQVRASYTVGDYSNNFPAFADPDGSVQDEDNPVGLEFAGLAANMTFGNGFVVAEYAALDFDKASGPFANVDGLVDSTGWYISAGYTFGSWTPHITYGETDNDYEQAGGQRDPIFVAQDLGTVNEAWQTITVGARYDFHPSAALKIEYTGQIDDSDEIFRNEAGFAGDGYGARQGVDVFNIGVDVLF